jgi:putative membrane protein insertion efficiency factor
MPEPRNGPTSASRLARQAALAALRAYKVALSPLVGGSCRFEPSCSTYASEAVSTHGLLRGGWLAAKRLSRCHPFGSWGHDPVPPATQIGPERA